MADETHYEIERPKITNDVDAAHARIRSHQVYLDSLHGRIDGNERRIDRIEKRMDDQSHTLADLKATTGATQREVHSNSGMLARAVDRVDYMASRLDQHTAEEINAQEKQTQRMERLHRTLIRGISVLGVVAILLVVLTREHQPAWIGALIKVIGG